MKRPSFSRCIAILVAVTMVTGALAQLWAPEATAAIQDAGDTKAVRATISPHGGLVEWTSQFDNRILGFNVFRVTRGQRQKLNSSLIAGPTMVFEGHAKDFAWFDPAGALDSTYELESVDLRGQVLSQTVVTPGFAKVLPASRQAPLFGDVEPTRPTHTFEPDFNDGLKPNADEIVSSDTSNTLSQQWSIANQPALKIGIRADGWYRITQQQLAAAGFDVTGDSRNLQLFNEGNEVAINVSRETGVLTQSGFIEFWGQGLDRPTTDTRVYWLVNGQQTGKRISISGQLRPDTTPTPPAVILGPTPAAGYSHGSVNLSWWLADSASISANLTRPDEIASATKAVSAAVLSAPEGDQPETAPVKGSEARISQPPLSSQPVARPMPPAESNVAVPAASKAPATPARSLISVRSRARARRKAPRNHRRKNQTRRHNHAIDSGAAAPAFTCSTEYSNHKIYYTAALNGDQENFFGPVVSGSGATVTLTTRNIERTSTAPVQLTVSLQGVSLGAHQINVLVNGTPAGSISFADQSSTIQTLSFPGAWLIDGDNAIKLAPAPNSDTSLVDYLRVTYPHSFRAEDDSLQFSLKATQSARIDGFTGADIRVLDISDPSSAQIVRPFIDGSGSAFGATVPAGERGKARRFVALPATRISQPSWLALNQPSTLNSNTNAADLLIVAYKDFIPSLAPLVAQRQAQGYAVKTIDIDDVYDEFSFGEHTPQAIRDFMSLARNTWTRAPSYLLLVGDASLDPRNRLGNGNFDFVPTKLVDTGTPGAATALETASDDWLTDFDGNGIADIATGRLPVRTVAEANLVISKIANYSPANTGNKALLVADAQGSYYFNFEAANDQVATTLPAGMTVQKVYRRLQPSDADARTNIIANLNSGQTLTVYSGHGNVNIWGGSIFSAADAAALTNGNRLSFVVVMDCLNGYFADPSLNSLAESLLTAPSGGAVASFASSGLTIPDGQHEMGFRMFQLLYSGAPISIGDASRQAKLATNDMDVRRTWILLGDPTLKIR